MSHIDDLLFCASSTSVSLHFIRFFILGLSLTHIFHHVTLFLCKDWVQSSEFAFRRNGQLFLVLQSQPRVFSLSVIATVVQLCEVCLPRRTIRCSLSCQFLTHAVGFQTHSFFQVMYSFSSDSSSAVMSSSGFDDRHVPVGGRHQLGRLVQHLVVRCLVWSSLAPPPCLS